VRWLLLLTPADGSAAAFAAAAGTDDERPAASITVNPVSGRR